MLPKNNYRGREHVVGATVRAQIKDKVQELEAMKNSLQVWLGLVLELQTAFRARLDEDDAEDTNQEPSSDNNEGNEHKNKDEEDKNNDQ